MPRRLSGAKSNVSKAENQRRRAQSQRDKAMMANASLKSVPRRDSLKLPLKTLLPQALRSVQFAPRGHGLYDAFSNTVDSAIVSSSVGPCTVVEGFVRYPVIGYGPNGPPGADLPEYFDNSALIVFNPGNCRRVIAHVYRVGRSTEGDLETTVAAIEAPQFADSSEDVEGIPLRGSLRLTNVSETLNRGGTVRFMRYNGGLELPGSGSGPGTASAYIDLCDLIRSSARTLSLSGADLVKAHQSNSYPADFRMSVAFEHNQSFLSAVRKPAYSTVLVLIDSFFPAQSSYNNTYELSLKVQRACRYGMGTTLHTLARELPVMSQETQAKHLHGESRGPAAKPSAVGRAVASAARDAMSAAAQGAGQRLAGEALKKGGKALGGASTMEEIVALIEGMAIV